MYNLAKSPPKPNQTKPNPQKTSQRNQTTY